MALELAGVQLLPKSQPFDLDIRSGEVTGVFGLFGSGGVELAHGIFGAEPFVSGEMALKGEPYSPKHRPTRSPPTSTWFPKTASEER